MGNAAMSNDSADKVTQRKLGLQARRAMTVEQRLDASLTIAERAFRLPCWRRAQRIGVYLPTAEEVDTWPIIERAWRMKKRVFAPRVRKSAKIEFHALAPHTSLVHNAYSILEPDSDVGIDVQRLDIVFTPLVAFDNRGERIGWGGGYFDRTFAFANLRQSYSRPKLIGLAFACQEFERVATDALDVPLYQVVTD